MFVKIKKMLKKKLSKGNSPEKIQEEKISRAEKTKNLSLRLASIRERLGESNDIIIHSFKDSGENLSFGVVFVDGMADKVIIYDYIIRPLQKGVLPRDGRKNVLQALTARITSNAEVSTVKTLSEALQAVLAGDTALFMDGEENILVFGTRSWESRAVEEPVAETSVRGSREGFVETLRINTSLLRRRVRHEKLRLETMKAGRMTGTDINLAYIEGVVNQRVLEEARRRIAAIDIDGILESGYVEELIEDSTWSVFPQIEHTERVDKAAAALLEGRVVIMVDNTPFVLIVPTVFFQFLQAAEDYYERPFIATAQRLLRLLALNIALMLPAIYVAITTFHQEMLPTPLLLSIAAGREGVPFPAVGEALIMETTFEVLREAGVRLPQMVGQAVSIVGGLVIGDAAIRAGIVSPAMVIVVAGTAISSFALPAFKAAISLRLLRFPLIIMGAMMGLYGVIFGLILILIHLAGMQSFGVPYLSPLVHGTASDMGDSFIRLPWRLTRKRPRMLDPHDETRQGRQKAAPEVPGFERELTHEQDTDDD